MGAHPRSAFVLCRKDGNRPDDLVNRRQSRRFFRIGIDAVRNLGEQTVGVSLFFYSLVEELRLRSFSQNRWERRPGR
jgi:hypothetical protein